MEAVNNGVMSTVFRWTLEEYETLAEVAERVFVELGGAQAY